MKKIFTLLMAFAICLTINAQTTKTMTWDDTTRTYLEYVPASYNSNSPAPVLFVLHGLGDDMNNMFTATGFKAIADQHGWIVITPQALDIPISLMGYTMPVGAAWNSGISASVLGTNLTLSEGVDDSGFLMAILDDLIAHYNVDQSNVFCTGFSMGGFMSNRLAIEHGDRLKAIASVSGTVGNMLQENTPIAHVNAMHIHGTADQTVTYEDASFSVSIISAQVGLGAEQTVDYWRNFNQCATTPAVTNFPDNVNDGLTFEKYEYSGGINGTKVAFIKNIGGDHEWYYTPANDIDYATEIYNFFVSCMSTGLNENESRVAVYPNPACQVVNVESEVGAQISIYNMAGQKVMYIDSADALESINVSNLSEGVYVVRVVNGQAITNSKISIIR